MMPVMTTNFKEEHLRPYFLWDETMTIGELRQILRSGKEEERLYYMAKILREARYEDVWEFLKPSKMSCRIGISCPPVWGSDASFGNFC